MEHQTTLRIERDSSKWGIGPQYRVVHIYSGRTVAQFESRKEALAYLNGVLRALIDPSAVSV